MMNPGEGLSRILIRMNLNRLQCRSGLANDMQSPV